MSCLKFILSTLTGFVSFLILSHPNSSLNKRLPTIKIKIIQFLPSVRIMLGKRTIHVHHWLYISVILIISITSNPDLFGSINSKGFLLGSIFQGITYPDWKKIIHKKQ